MNWMKRSRFWVVMEMVAHSIDRCRYKQEGEFTCERFLYLYGHASLPSQYEQYAASARPFGPHVA